MKHSPTFPIDAIASLLYTWFNQYKIGIPDKSLRKRKVINKQINKLQRAFCTTFTQY